MAYDRYEKLERVSNHRARRLIIEARNCSSTPEGFYPTRNPLPGVLASLPEANYFDWVDEYTTKLFASDISQRLLNDKLLQPSIYEAMPETARSFLSDFMPRSPRQVVQHLVRYMDWYIGDIETVDCFYLLNVGAQRWFVLLLEIATLIIAIWLLAVQGDTFRGIGLLVMLLFLLLLPVVHTRSWIWIQSPKYWARAEALTLCLKVSYADRPDMGDTDQANIGI